MTGRRKASAAPMLNEYSTYTRAATFGNADDLYYHAPVGRIGSNYTPSSVGALERREAPPAAGVARKAKRDEEKLRAVRAADKVLPPYPTMTHPPRRKDGVPIVIETPVVPLKEGNYVRGGAPASPFADEDLPVAKPRDRFTAAQKRALADAVTRYYYYIEHGVRTDDTIAPMKEAWYEKIMASTPSEPSGAMPRETFARLFRGMLDETREDYLRAMKKSIVDYALANANERERLDLTLLTSLIPRAGEVSRPHDELPYEWRANVEASREDVAWTLQTLNPHALILSETWETKYATRRFVDVDSETFRASLPVESTAFDAHQTETREALKKTLWSEWVVETAAVFNDDPPACVNGDADAFYESIATLQSNQLRGLVQKNVDAYAAFFESHDVSDRLTTCDPLSTIHAWSKPAAFVVRLNPDVAAEERTSFDPPFDAVTETCVAALDRFVAAAAGAFYITLVPIRPRTRGERRSLRTFPGASRRPPLGFNTRPRRLSTPPDAFQLPPRQSLGFPKAGAVDDATTSAECVGVVDLDDATIVNARDVVTRVMERNAIAPRALAKLFDPFLDLLTLDLDAFLQKFKEKDRSLEKYAEEIDAYFAKARAVRATSMDHVRAGAYVVDVTALKTTLVDVATRTAKALLDQVRTACLDGNRKINAAYAFMSEEVVKTPTTNEEALNLRKYIKNCEAEEKAIGLEIKANKARDAFLEGYYHEAPQEDFDVAIEAYGWPAKMKEIMRGASIESKKAERAFEDKLKKERAAFQEKIMSYRNEVDDLAAEGDVARRAEVAEIVTKLAENLAAATSYGEDLNVNERLFGWAPTKFNQITQYVNRLEPYRKLWTIAHGFFRNSQQWLTGAFSKLDYEAVEEEVSDHSRNIFKLVKVFSGQTGGDRQPEALRVALAAQEKLESFKTHLPLIGAVCNPGLRDRHWEAMTEVIGIAGFTLQKDEYTSLQRLIDKNVPQHLAKLIEISDFASREWSFEKTLDKMLVDWEGLCFGLKPWKETGTFILEGGPIDEAQALLDDHIVKTQAMRASPFAKPFVDRTTPWEAKLLRLQDIVDQWLKCQAKWLYLEPIFGSEEIMKQIPTEGAAFMSMDATWRQICSDVRATPEVIACAEMPDLLEKLQGANAELDVVEKGLNDFLDTKKLAFPRFFFLSNDELLEILSEAKDPLKVQPFMKKCFEAVKEVEFTKAITMKAMVSVEGEVVPLSKEIDPAETGAVEMWMLEFEDVMKESMREVTAKSIAEYATVSREEWILNWPGQVVIAGSQVYWTKEVTDAIVADGPKGLAAYGEKSNANLTNIVNMVRGELSKLERATMSALVTIDVHARDVVVQMAEDGVSDARDFKWLAQLRYFWEDETLRVRMINAEAQYGFEYLGNSSRLVITPLTDRCYRTLMGAIHLNLGGAPAGPAGTGKTETTKDLSKAIAIQCVVFNCSDGLDYKAMGKFFKGLAASGAWACFDEFNRIELEVLSVVAQQVLCIQRAVAAKVKTFEFEGVELRIIPTANVFITMNPGYAGRSELPDNLKALFRDVAMMVPDYAMIAEIILYSFGYLEARDMARKLVQTYRLCSEQLSSQDHYDYGMRAVISVLRAAGNLKRKFTEEREDVLMLRAITDVNLPKFLDQDVPLFRGILSDLFPGVDLPEIDYDNLLAAMRNNTKKANLQPLPSFEEKIIQLYEMIIVRHGLMIVGESFGMKSSCISVLAGALGELNEKGQNGEQKVKYYCINPKSITMGQLYGAEDPVSKEWADGILAVTFRNAARDTSPDRKWVVFDGPVDAIWIENMNTVLDDNKKLCLNSGEIIAMQGLMNMIFEVADLAVASPATVSRCGMVYVQPSLLGWRPVFLSWLDTLPPTLNEPQKEQITGMFDWLVPPCLRIATKMCKQPQPMQEINLAQSLMRLYESLLDEFRDEEKVAEMNKLLQAVWLDSLFLFALVWSIGASVDQEGRVKFDAMLRQLLAGDVPEELKIWMTAEPRKVTKLIPDANSATVYDFVFDKATGQWAKWTATQEDAPIAEEATYTSIIVPTVDTIRYTYLIDTFVLHQKNFLFVGPTGTGKTAYIKQHVANGIDPEKYSYLFMNFSAQTSANMTQVRPTHWSPYDRVGVVNADP